MKILRKILPLALLITMVPFQSAFAEFSFGPTGLANPIPGGGIFPTPQGILFPGTGNAAGINPAAIPLERGNVFQLAYGHSLQAGDPTTLFGGFATSNGTLGIGLGYLGQINGSLTNGAFVGMGYKIDKVSFGIAVRDPDVSAGSLEGDFGFTYKSEAGVMLGAVLYQLNNGTRPNIGIGYQGGKRFHAEANILFPPLTSFGNNYRFLLSALINIGGLGISFTSSYYTSDGSATHMVALHYWLGEKVDLFLQFMTPRNPMAGLTFKF